MSRKRQPPLTLHQFACSYVARRGLSKDHADTLRRRADAFQKFVGDAVLVRILNEWNVNEFLLSLGHLSSWTIKGYRGDILTLWNAAADEELIAYPIPRKIRRPKLASPVIDCFVIEEIQALIATADKLELSLAPCEPGYLSNGVSIRDYFSAIIRAAWDTGLRRGDLWRFDRAMLRPDGSFKIVQNKTKRAVRRQLRPSTLTAVNRIPRGLPFAWPHATTTFADVFRQIVRQSGVGRGTFKWLRRASGSYCELQQPGSGAKALGHQHAAIFYRHYDAQLEGTLPMPPELS